MFSPDYLLEIIDRARHGAGRGLGCPDLVPDDPINRHQDLARTRAVPENVTRCTLLPLLTIPGY